MADLNTRIKGRPYDVPTNIRPVDGVSRREYARFDAYAGTADALIAAGVLRPGNFPGAPGMPSASMSFRPRGIDRGDGSWCYVPGYMQVFLKLDGTFRVLLNVSKEETLRRGQATAAPEFRIICDALRVERYGRRLLNAYGSGAQLIAAGFLPPDFDFPPLTKVYARKEWANGPIEYRVQNRHASQANASKEVRTDHWWFQVQDRSQSYPSDTSAIYKAELGKAGHG